MVSISLDIRNINAIVDSRLLAAILRLIINLNTYKINNEGYKRLGQLKRDLVFSVIYAIAAFILVNSFFVYIRINDANKDPLFYFLYLILLIVFFSNRTFDIINSIRNINQFVIQVDISKDVVIFSTINVSLFTNGILTYKPHDEKIDKIFLAKIDKHSSKWGTVGEIFVSGKLKYKVIKDFFQFDDMSYQELKGEVFDKSTVDS